MRGFVRLWDSDRAFGFIRSDEGGFDTFLHISQVQRSGLNGIAEGDRLEFEVGTNPHNGRPMAVNLRMLG